MMSDFQPIYLELLRKQVEEEIQFLVANGHQAERITNPCMFCIDTHKGYYRCYRLNELKQFASSIMTNIGQNRAKKVDRLAIGFENSISESDNLDPVFQII